MEDITASNFFLTVENGKLKYKMGSTDNVKDSECLDESRRRKQLTKKGSVSDGCYKIYKPTKCAAAQELVIQVEEKETAEMKINFQQIPKT